MMDREMELKSQKYYQKIEATKQNNIGDLGQVVDEAPSMYTPDDVIAKASALYNFVSDSSSASSATFGAVRSSYRDEGKHRK